MECRDSVTFCKLTSLDHEFRKHCNWRHEWGRNCFIERTRKIQLKIGLVVTMEDKLNKVLRVQVSCECAFANLHWLEGSCDFFSARKIMLQTFIGLGGCVLSPNF